MEVLDLFGHLGREEVAVSAVVEVQWCRFVHG